MIIGRSKKYSLKLSIFLFVFCNNAVAKDYTKQWTTDIIIGSLPNSDKFKYYIESQLRLIDDPYVFNQAFLLTGLGYQFTPTLAAFMGPGFVLTKNTTEGVTYNEFRLWQQLNWAAANNASIRLDSRTRTEEKLRSNESQIALQLRQRLWMRIPLTPSKQYYFSSFDEVFFNINHPSWVSPRFFEQNRTFIGMAKQLSKSTLVDFGYLYQLQFGPPRKTSNVILLCISTNL